MKTVNRRDIVSALTTGLTAGLIAWRILLFLGTALPFGIAPVVLALVVPVLWVAGVQLGYFLSRFFRPMAQFGRFAAIGFANVTVDFGVLYVFIAATGQATGYAYALFKAASFMVATVHSYFWNKFWAFEAGSSRGGTAEIVRFATVALTAILVNVIVATGVVYLRPAAIAAEAWAGVGAAAGSATALIFSFAGFRAFVFRKKRV